jgi:thiol reductant ABC exporter CydC subunit
MVAIVGVRAFALSRAVCRYAERLVSHDVSFGLLARLRGWLYVRLEPLLPSGLGDLRLGDVLSRLMADVDALRDVFIRALAPPFVAIMVLGLAVGLVWLLAPAAVPALAVPFLVSGAVLPWLAWRLSRSAAAAQAALRGRLSAGLVELLAGAAEVAAFGRGPERIGELRSVDRLLARAGRRLASLSGALEGAQLLAAGLAVTGVLASAVPATRSGSLDGVWLAVLALAALAAFEAVQPLPEAFQRLERGLVSAGRITAVAGRRRLVIDPPHPAPVEGAAVALEDAWLRYRPAGPWALAGVDLRLEPGRRVALVGPSGAGKTSVANVLLRFHELERGRATLGGRDLGEHAQEDVRRVIGLCAQDAHVFATSLLENVRLARPGAAPGEIEAAAARAGMLGWVRSLPRGWDTPAGDAGDQLSGGQRQRLALARALLAGFPVLILDEPTANLDADTADRLMADVLAATAWQTLLVITHRLQGLEAMDEVVVLEAGQVVERGPYRELACRPGVLRAMLDLAPATRM